MRLTIVPCDNFVAVDGVARQPLDLRTCGVPADVHALQWFGTTGWIEFVDPTDPFASKQANEPLAELPAWATACANVWAAA